MRNTAMLTALVAGLMLPGLAWADNTTRDGAYSLMAGGTPAEAALSSTTPERWFRSHMRYQNSYCVETQGGVFFDASATAGSIATEVTVYGLSATAIGSNDQADEDPYADTLSRFCFVAPETYTVWIKVSRATWTPQATAFNFRLRFVNTTLFSNWFFTGGDYAAYTLLRNTVYRSTGPVSYTLTWRSLAGSVIATTSGTLNGQQGTYVNARDFPEVVAAVSGTVEVVHTGSPGAIVASTTVLSPTTGLSFDAPFAGIMGRQPW